MRPAGGRGRRLSIAGKVVCPEIAKSRLIYPSLASAIGKSYGFVGFRMEFKVNLDSNSVTRLDPSSEISCKKGQVDLHRHETSLTLREPLATTALGALFITGFATFINVYATQPLLPEFRRIFSASELLVSLTVSAPVLAVVLIAPLVGLLADAMGRKRVIVAAILGLVVPTALTATAANLYYLIIWRFLQGLSFLES